LNFNHLLILALLFVLSPAVLKAQADGDFNDETINVYLDCRGCNGSYVRTEINFINFVRDQNDAEVHLLITLQQTGSGGWEHTLNFMGKGFIADKSHTMKFISPSSDTNDMMRQKLVRHVKLGLIYFLADREVLSDLNVNFAGTLGGSDGEEVENTDPWNSWIFEIGASTSFSGEQSRGNFRLNGNLNARRITEEWKMTFDYRQNYNRRIFRRENNDGSTDKDIFVTENQDFSALIAKSFGDHWTAGGYSKVESSTQSNIDLSIGATPSIEYSVFPYREFNKREITFRFGVLASHYDYTETTILNKDEEFLLRNEFAARANFTQPWGGMVGWINAGAYMHDMSKNRVNMGFRINMRILRGLSVNFSGNYSLINDQITIAAGDLTEEERLLNLKQQATSYNFGGSVGFQFNFGSIYNNVVNPRF